MLNLILTPEYVAEGFLSAACASSLVRANLGSAVEGEDAEDAVTRMSLQSHREECLNRSIKLMLQEIHLHVVHRRRSSWPPFPLYFYEIQGKRGQDEGTEIQLHRQHLGSPVFSLLR
ncbi:unnamed protein product [Amoebophrya sp. A25]|nr:unnamed protein product [Amoebophrya sp. A25]|eukprot:GSA25T00017862001.1